MKKDLWKRVCVCLAVLLLLGIVAAWGIKPALVGASAYRDLCAELETLHGERCEGRELAVLERDGETVRILEDVAFVVVPAQKYTFFAEIFAPSECTYHCQVTTTRYAVTEAGETLGQVCRTCTYIAHEELDGLERAHIGEEAPQIFWEGTQAAFEDWSQLL